MKNIKKIVIMCVLFLTSLTSNSQIIISLLFGDALNSSKIEFGLDGGMAVTDIKGVASKYSNSFNLGFYFDFKYFNNPSLMINTGLIVKSTYGAEGIPVYSLNEARLNDLYSEGSITREMGYFNIPILLKYKFKNNIYIKGGTQISILYTATDYFNTTVDNGTLTYENNVYKDYHPFDAGVKVGFGYKFMKGNGMNVGISYYEGLIDTTIDDVSPNQTNRAIYFNIGIPIGSSKSADVK